MPVIVQNDAAIYFNVSQVVKEAFYKLAAEKGKKKGEYINDLIIAELRANGVSISITEKIV